MKVQVIGDIHGRIKWKPLIDESCDKIIFIGDYVDSYTIDNITIKDNLLDIIEYKKRNIDLVELIIGNHDMQYIYFPEYRCAGFRPEMAPDLQMIFRDNVNLFKIAYQFEDHLFTHAGVTKNWLKWAEDKLKLYGYSNLGNLGEALNNMNETSNRWVLNNVGYGRGGLRGDYGGPTWADKKETWFDAIPGLKQYVGHTPVADIHQNSNEEIDDVGVVTYCDCLPKDRTLITEIL